MIEAQNNNSFKFRWPKYTWVIFLQTVFYIWLAICLGLTAIWLWDVVLIYLDEINFSILEVLQTSYFTGWVILAYLVLMYWSYRLNSNRITKINGQPLTDFLEVCSLPTKKIIWQGLNLWQKGQSNQFLLRHLLPSLFKHKGVKLTLLRLGISASDINESFKDHTDEVEEILVQAYQLASADKLAVSWHHLLKAILVKSESFAEILAQDKTTVKEAVAVVNWSKKDIEYTAPKVRHGLVYDLLSPKRNLNKNWTARPTPVLDRFSKNMTEIARLGFLTSAKVRGEEVEESIRVLSKSSENSLVLVGEPGVGKTSIVGDIALRMIQGDIPSLEDYKLISLDIGAMMGSKIGFQKLFSRAVLEASGSGNTILFIGNLDQLGKARAEEGFDLSAILLSALQNNLQLIGTSDPLNYKKYIDNNANLSQLFSKVDIEELGFDEAVLVMEDLSRQIESQQGVLITLAAIKKAAELAQKYIHTGKIPDKAIDLLDEAAVHASRNKVALVTTEHVEITMSSKTNIPIGEMGADEKTKLAGLEDKIKTRLIGQEEAVQAVASSLKRARLGVSASSDRPIGTFLFLGPTGVGKTELAKTLAWSYFGDETKIVRLDMSEYQTKDSVQRLLGVSVASGDAALAGGKFTETIKQTPFTVVLLDEIEKAHPEILDIFLQVLDEGRLTDNLGNTIDFTHTIIIATSNAQARFVQEAVDKNVPYANMQKELIDLLVKKSFRPEFINRFDGVIVFKPLTKSEIVQISKIKLNNLIKHLKENKGIELQLGEGVVEKIAELGFDPAFGARPLNRVIRDKIETKIADALLVSDDTSIKIGLGDIS